MIGVAALAGGASLIGGALANRGRRQESQRNRQFQERMRNTEWQAAVADMEKAGINPALAYSQGGAASPSGSIAGQQDVGGPAVGSALQATRLKEELGLIREQKKAATQQGIKTGREARFQEMQNRLWGGFTGPGDSHFKPGPLWDLNVANAKNATEVWKGRVLENTLLKNMADVADTPLGQQSAFLRYMMQAWRGRQ